MFTWLPQPHIPHPPQEFIDRALQAAPNYRSFNNSALNQIDPKYLNRRVVKDDTESSSRIQYGIELGEDWHAWVKANVMTDYISTGARVSAGENTTIHGAHTDCWLFGKPCYKLYYLIDRGGEDAMTYFFKEKGQPVERKGTMENIVFVDDYSQLEIIDEVRFPMNQWVLFNTNILHGVENVIGTRTNLVVIFDDADITLKLQRTF